MPQPLSISLGDAGQCLIVHPKINFLGALHQGAGNRDLAESRSLAHLLCERPEVVPWRLKDIDARLLGLVQAKIGVQAQAVPMG